MKEIKKTPLKLNQRLIKAARETARYSGGDMSTRGTWNVDSMFDPAKEVMAKRMLKKEIEKKKKEELEKQNAIKNGLVENPNKKEETFVPPINENQEKETEIPPAPERYKSMPCSETKGDSNYHADCWMGIVSIETEEWKEWDSLYGSGSATPMKSPMKRHAKTYTDPSKTPFKKYSALKTKIRANYVPKQKQETSPLQQKNQEPLIRGDRFPDEMFGKAGVMPSPDVELPKTIWSTFEEVSEEELNEIKLNAITNDVSNNEEFGDVIKPIEKIPNKEWKEVIRTYFGSAKENIVNAVKDGQTDFKETWMGNARNLTTNIQQYLIKRDDWSLNNAGDQSLTNKGGSMVSNGSHKGDSRQWDLTYLGAPNIILEVSEEGDMYFKLEDVDDIWSVKDLDRNVHNKDYRGLQIWTDLKKEIKKAAREGQDFNSPAIESIINGIIQTPEAANSWAHDNLDGENMFDRFYKARNVEFDLNIDPFMREHPDYNIEIITDMVKNGMINMAKQTHSLASSAYKKTKPNTSLSAKQLIEKYK